MTTSPPALGVLAPTAYISPILSLEVPAMVSLSLGHMLEPVVMDEGVVLAAHSQEVPV